SVGDCFAVVVEAVLLEVPDESPDEVLPSLIGPGLAGLGVDAWNVAERVDHSFADDLANSILVGIESGEQRIPRSHELVVELNRRVVVDTKVQMMGAFLRLPVQDHGELVLPGAGLEEAEGRRVPNVLDAGGIEG